MSGLSGEPFPHIYVSLYQMVPVFILRKEGMGYYVAFISLCHIATRCLFVCFGSVTHR